MSGTTIALRLDVPALPLGVEPGGEIVLRGSFHSTLDGATVDAATTTWPSSAPGGPSVDQGGLVDFEGGGWHMTSRDPAAHEVHAIATGESGAACAAAGVNSPCLPLRTLYQARSRLVTAREWSDSLKGGIRIEIQEVPAYRPAVTWAGRLMPVGLGLAGLLIVAGIFAAALMWYRRWQASASRQLVLLAERLRDRVVRTDPVLAAPLSVAIETALAAVRGRRLDPASPQGRRVCEVLTEVDRALDAAEAEHAERVADDLVRDIQIALEAAEEAARVAGGEPIRR
jgi:hypothetical protein